MAVQSGAALSGRDLRLDFFRGLALFCIFIDHIPNNIFNLVTIQSLGFSDAAEMFILISGYTAGLVFGRIFDERGFVVAGVRVYLRVWQLYVAHVFLFMLFMAMVAHTASTLNSAIYAEELGVADFLREPDVAVVMALLLLFQPAFMDILPIYIVLLGVLPVILVAFRASARIALAFSFALWLAVQVLPDINLPSYPGPDTSWYFNPFAWQFLFFLGAFLGWRGISSSRWRVDRLFIGAVIAIVAASFVIHLSWIIHWFYDPIPPILYSTLDPLSNKTELSWLRLINILALAVLVVRFVGPRDSWLQHRAAYPFILCGRHSLHVFCLGILLAIIARMVLNEFYGGIAAQAAVTAAGIGIMICVAWLMDWVRANVTIARSSQHLAAGGGGE
jgi:hypothetical protein